MKESNYKSYDELPLFLNAATIAKVLGIAPSSSYELMHEKDFPALRIGNRIVVPKEAFLRWVEQHTGGTECGRDRDLRLPAVLRGQANIPVLAELPENR